MKTERQIKNRIHLIQNEARRISEKINKASTFEESHKQMMDRVVEIARDIKLLTWVLK